VTFGTKLKLNLTFLIISRDKIWIFWYGPETKNYSTLWKIPDSPRLKEAKMSKSKYEAMLMIFSSKKELSIQNLFPKDKLSIRHFALGVLQHEGRSEAKKCILLLDKRVWHQENAPPHTVVLVRQFLMQELILLTEHSPCSPCGCL
jgi:hypothetical protein